MILNKELARVKALVIEDFGDNGKVSINYNKSQFPRLLKDYSEFEITKIFEPTKEQEVVIVSKMLEKAQVDENGKVKTSILMTDMLLEVIPMLTDIEMEINLEKEEDREYLKQLINDPIEVLKNVNEVLSNIMSRIFTEYVANLDKFDSLPKKEQDKIVAEAERIVKEQNEDIEAGMLQVEENLLMVEEDEK